MKVETQDVVENWTENQLKSHNHLTETIIHALKRIKELNENDESIREWYPGKGATALAVKRFINNNDEIKIEKLNGQVKERVSASHVREVLHTYWNATDYVKREKVPQRVLDYFPGSPNGPVYTYTYVTPEELQEKKDRKESIRQKMIDAGITEI